MYSKNRLVCQRRLDINELTLRLKFIAAIHTKADTQKKIGILQNNILSLAAIIDPSYLFSLKIDPIFIASLLLILNGAN